MALFGGGQTAQILMQGVQLLNNTLAQAQQLEMQREQQDRAYKMQQDELEMRKRTLDKREEFDELDRQIKVAQLAKTKAEAQTSALRLSGAPARQQMEMEKLELEKQIKSATLEKTTASGKKAASDAKARVAEIDEQLDEYRVGQSVLQQQHLKLASDDPVELNRRFQTVSALSTYRDSISRSMAEPSLSETEKGPIMAELSSVDQSLRWRLEKAAKDFGRTREEMVPEPDTGPAPQGASTPVQDATTTSGVTAAQTGSVLDFQKLMADTQIKGDAQLPAKESLRTTYAQKVAAGGDGLKIFVNFMLKYAPGKTSAERISYVQSILKGS